MRRTVRFGIVALLFVGTVLALGAAGQSEAATGSYPLTWLTVGDTAARALGDEDRILATIEDITGVNLQMQIVAEGGWDRVNVAIASGDLPDIVTGQLASAATNQWIRDGILVPLNDYLPQLPHIAERLEEESWTAVDGEFYGYPFVNQKSTTNAALTTRSDWLENVGKDVPTTLEEFRDVLRAFVNDDPNRSGRADTYGITTQGPIGTFNWAFYAYGVQYGDWALDEAGNPIPHHEHPGFRQGMVFLRSLWDEGLIDAEFMLNDRNLMEEKWYQGRAGYVTPALFRHVSRLESNVQAISPEAELVYHSAPVGPEGHSGYAVTGKGGMFTGITIGSQDPQKAAEFLDFFVSPEGFDLLTLGIEGIHFERTADGGINYIEEERARDNFAANGWAHPLAWGHVRWPLSENYLPMTEPARDRAIDSVEVATADQMPNLIPYITQAEIEYGGVVNEIYEELFLEMLIGRKGVDEGIAELSRRWRNQGGDRIMEDVIQAYRELQ